MRATFKRILQLCREQNVQNCDFCINFACDDNMFPPDEISCPVMSVFEEYCLAIGVDVDDIPDLIAKKMMRKTVPTVCPID